MLNSRFPLLSLVSLLMRLLGALLVLGSVIYAYKEGIAEPSMQGHHFGAEDAFQLLGGLAGALLGLLAFAVGEAVGVLFAIEANTRRSADAAEHGRGAA